MCDHPEGLLRDNSRTPGGIDIPHLPGDEEPPEYLAYKTYDLKLVSDYSGLNFEECLKLDCITYRMLVRDAQIHRLSKTEEGQKYLEDCWILRQTKPDKKKLRQFAEGRI